MKQENDDLRRLIDKKEVAAIWGTSTRTVEREVSAGRLKKYKIRGCVRFIKEDVLRLGRLVTP
ncbi:MAG: helix-turn-helix domain-containing protein [Luteolibacter sp.]